jgi:dienelactone hydrolase
MVQVPALVLRGDNDRNVTQEDFDLMRKAATASGSAAREFPGLNHEYMAASGDGRSAYVAGEIAPEVFNTIAQWVKTGHITQ